MVASPLFSFQRRLTLLLECQSLWSSRPIAQCHIFHEAKEVLVDSPLDTCSVILASIPYRIRRWIALLKGE